MERNFGKSNPKNIPKGGFSDSVGKKGVTFGNKKGRTKSNLRVAFRPSRAICRGIHHMIIFFKVGTQKGWICYMFMFFSSLFLSYLCNTPIKCIVLGLIL